MNDTYKLLAEREKTHGNYEETARISQAIKSAMNTSDGWPALESDMKESLELIATKIGRIISGDRESKEHWEDISGYAILVSRRIESESISLPSAASPSRVDAGPAAYQPQSASRFEHDARGLSALYPASSWGHISGE